MSSYIRFMEIADDIKAKVLNNVYKEHEFLPSEKQLSLEYSVSKSTVRHAINVLVDEGLLFTIPGKGTYVHAGAENNYKVDLRMEKILLQGYDSARLLTATITHPDVHQVYHLQIAPEERVVCIKWVLTREGKTVAYDEKNIPYLSGIPVDESNLGYMSLRELLIHHSFPFPCKETSSISAVLPDPELAKMLGAEEKSSSPVVRIDNKVYDEDNSPLGWCRIYLPAAEFQFKGESQ